MDFCFWGEFGKTDGKSGSPIGFHSLRESGNGVTHNTLGNYISRHAKWEVVPSCLGTRSPGPPEDYDSRRALRPRA